VSGDSVEHIQGVNPDVRPLVRYSNERIVQEHIEPSFIKFSLLSQDIGLAGVYQFFIFQVSLQTLDYFDFKFFVFRLVSRDMSVNYFADLLPLVRALTNKRAVAPEQMLGEELKEVVLRTVFVFVDMANQNFGEE
jgi:hypothetical protein